MLSEGIRVPNGPQPSGHFSQAVKANGLVFVAGMGPYDPATREVVGRGIEEQTAQVIRNIAAVLRGSGSGLADVVNCSVFLSEIERDWRAFDAAYGSFFSEPLPARTTVGAQLRGILVEIAAIAVVGR